jgi:hypothetical protein
MRCILLNRNYPPNVGITGYSAFKLAAYLSERGVEVHVVTVGGNYQGGVHSKKVTDCAKVHLVRKVYDGKNKALRLVAALIEGCLMSSRAVALGMGPLITLSDPPLLNYWVAMGCQRRGISWIYWAMDIYPEAFIAAGLAKKDGFFYRFLKRDLQRFLPQHLIALGSQQAEYLRKQAGLEVLTSILPCGVDCVERTANPPAWLPSGEKIIFGYIGNLGQAHDPRFVELVIAALDSERHHFILSAYGIHAARVHAYAKAFGHVTVLPMVEPEQLGFIDIHLASLEPAWDHICVPSKAVSAVCAGSSLLLCSSEEGDNWQLLKDASWRINPGDDMAAAVTVAVKSLTPDVVSQKRAGAQACRQNLLAMQELAMSQIFDAVQRLQGEKDPEIQARS